MGDVYVTATVSDTFGSLGTQLSGRRSDLKILVVEDEHIISMYAVMTLVDAGYEVVGPAATEGDGLALAQQHRPDLALLDVNSGAGGCGVTLARRLHRQLGIRALFVSASTDRARMARDVALGLLGKPWSAPSLVLAVAACRALLAGRSPDRVPAGFEMFGPHRG